MKKFILPCLFALSAGLSQAQTAPKPTPSTIPSGVPVKAGTRTDAAAVKADVDPGFLTETTYTNYGLGFDIAFPASWVIPGVGNEKYLPEKGYDLRPKIDRNDPQQTANIRRYEKQVTLLLTAYRRRSVRPAMPSCSSPQRTFRQIQWSKMRSIILTLCVPRSP